MIPPAKLLIAVFPALLLLSLGAWADIISELSLANLELSDAVWPKIGNRLNPDYLEGLIMWALVVGVMGLVISIYLHLRVGRIVTHLLIIISAVFVWPTCHAAFHELTLWRVRMVHPPQECAYIFFSAAAVSALAIFAELKLRGAAIPLGLAALPPALAAVAVGTYLTLTY